MCRDTFSRHCVFSFSIVGSDCHLFTFSPLGRYLRGERWICDAIPDLNTDERIRRTTTTNTAANRRPTANHGEPSNKKHYFFLRPHNCQLLAVPKRTIFMIRETQSLPLSFLAQPSRATSQRRHFGPRSPSLLPSFIGRVDPRPRQRTAQSHWSRKLFQLRRRFFAFSVFSSFPGRARARRSRSFSSSLGSLAAPRESRTKRRSPQRATSDRDRAIIYSEESDAMTAISAVAVARCEAKEQSIRSDAGLPDH